MLGVAPAAYAAWSRLPEEGTPVALPEPAASEGWISIRTPPSSWTPAFQGTDAAVRTVYEREGGLVECYIGFYRSQTQGRELVHYANVIAPRGDAVWKAFAERDLTVPAQGGGSIAAHETLVRSPSLRYVVWHWYWVPDEFTVSRARAKLLQARTRLLRRPDRGAVVILSAPYAGDPERARGRLAAFTRAMVPSIRRSILEAGAPH